MYRPSAFCPGFLRELANCCTRLWRVGGRSRSPICTIFSLHHVGPSLIPFFGGHTYVPAPGPFVSTCVQPYSTILVLDRCRLFLTVYLDLLRHTVPPAGMEHKTPKNTPPLWLLPLLVEPPPQPKGGGPRFFCCWWCFVLLAGGRTVCLNVRARENRASAEGRYHGIYISWCVPCVARGGERPGGEDVDARKRFRQRPTGNMAKTQYMWTRRLRPPHSPDPGTTIRQLSVKAPG